MSAPMQGDAVELGWLTDEQRADNSRRAVKYIAIAITILSLGAIPLVTYLFQYNDAEHSPGPGLIKIVTLAALFGVSTLFQALWAATTGVWIHLRGTATSVDERRHRRFFWPLLILLYLVGGIIALYATMPAIYLP